jgi:hypothetical protein
LEDVEEKQEVNDLLTWWNRQVLSNISVVLTKLANSQIFPAYSSARPIVTKNSALARIKEKRVEQRAALVDHDRNV